MLIDELKSLMDEMKWDLDDEISISVGGTQIYEIEGNNTKWSPNKGTRKYNKDAFIVIKNETKEDLKHTIQ